MAARYGGRAARGRFESHRQCGQTKMIFSLYVRPEIKTVEAPKKKNRITPYGSTPDISILRLKKYNLNPEKDLTLIQLGFMATVAGG